MGGLLLLPIALAAQATSVPAAIRLRLAQALWPEIQFDTVGVPIAGYRVRSFRGDPATGLGIELAPPDTAIPGVITYRGSATRCFDCTDDRAAVMMHDSESITVIAPEDLELAMGWFGTGTAFDSASVHAHIMGLLRSSCILGCWPRPFYSKSEIDPGYLPICQAADKGTSWSAPPTYVHPNGSYVQYELGIWAEWRIYSVSVYWSAKSILVRAELIADCALHA